jgi:mRNA interferase MazF
MSYRRGDVVLALFPNSDLRTSKRRPVVIVEADHLGTGINQHVTALVTSNMTRLGHPSRVLIQSGTPEWQQSGLQTTSIIMTDNLVTIFESELDRTIGSLPDMSQVDAALRHTLGL